MSSSGAISDSESNAFITRSLLSVNERINAAYLKVVSNGIPRNEPRLVAVTKTKPVEMILHAYKQGQRHFGENYVQELVEKSQHPSLVELEDICWHFIGHLQRNKCNNVVACPHLWAVETVDTERLANALDASWKKKGADKKLGVYIQVNTSGEESKHGCQSDVALALVRHVIDCCSSLKFCGLMTIGRSSHDYFNGPNPDFECLKEVQKRVCEELGMDMREVELSMGMSSDFEQAICAGSTNVRIGSVIFGSR